MSSKKIKTLVVTLLTAAAMFFGYSGYMSPEATNSITSALHAADHAADVVMGTNAQSPDSSH
jgi:hypothetical protein